jgi:hypothetical protein
MSAQVIATALEAHCVYCGNTARCGGKIHAELTQSGFHQNSA